MEQATGNMQRMHLAVLLNKHTTKACLRRFVEGEGGLAILHAWLLDAKKLFPKRRKRILQLLDTFQCLPINLEALKKTQLGKTVKSLSKLNDTEISDKSQKLVSSWLGLLAPHEMAQPPTASATAASAPSTATEVPRKRTLYVIF